MGKQYYHPLCGEEPNDCVFRLAEYLQDKPFHYERTTEHCLIYCRKGHLRITSNLFAEETLCEGEVMFLPRMNDYRGVVLSDTELLIHEFNNTVCRPEQCILAYLYTHRKIQVSEGKLFYHCKLLACKPMIALFDATIFYIRDGKSDRSVWKTKHMELIWIFTNYYPVTKLRSFFHPMTDEHVPFKSLVLSHYRKANGAEELAKLCGYGVYTFRRIFKAEFGVPVYQWLNKKRAEHILHQLSMTQIPLSEIIDEFNFSSPAHFSHFCKKHLGDVPSNIRRDYTNKEGEKE